MEEKVKDSVWIVGDKEHTIKQKVKPRTIFKRPRWGDHLKYTSCVHHSYDIKNV